LANDRPQNFGEVLFKAASQGVSTAGATYQADQQQRKENALKGFMSVLQFERGVREQDRHNLMQEETRQRMYEADNRIADSLLKQWAPDKWAEKQAAATTALMEEENETRQIIAKANLDLLGEQLGGLPGSVSHPGMGSRVIPGPSVNTRTASGLTHGQSINEKQQAFSSHLKGALQRIIQQASAINIAKGGKPIKDIAGLQEAGIGYGGKWYVPFDSRPSKEGVPELLKEYQRLGSEEYRNQWMSNPENIAQYAPELGGGGIQSVESWAMQNIEGWQQLPDEVKSQIIAERKAEMGIQ